MCHIMAEVHHIYNKMPMKNKVIWCVGVIYDICDAINEWIVQAIIIEQYLIYH